MEPTIDHPGLVPGMLLGSGAAGRHTARDWVVDAVMVVAAVLLGLTLLGYSEEAPESDLAELGEVVALAASSLALLWRRRWPVQVGVVTSLLSAVFIMAGPAAGFGLFAVAVHRRLTDALAVGVLGVACSVVLWSIYPDGEFAVLLGFAVCLLAGIIAWGAFVRARRQLVVSLRERVEQAEAQQRLLADQARQAERSRIAREMHDVVAHRVSLVALHAGGLQVRPDLSPEQVRETAGLIRVSAQDALDELRAVIGVLRESADGLERPQPTLADVPDLVAQSCSAGAHVELVMDVSAPVPGSLARDAYRVVQEGLTNVHKHAPGTSVCVTLRGAAGAGLSVEVRNRLPLHAPEHALRGSGTGLLGLTERVSLSGGRLTHGRVADDFVVAAQLPWEPA
jgi:signal transduction histidine kinase